MRRHLVFFLAVFSAACTKQDDGEALRKATVSWTATLQLVADARLARAVPARFVSHTIDEAVEDLSGQSAKPSVPGPVAQRAKRVIGLAEMLRGAVDHDHRAAIARLRTELAR
jgi:hypothetical protein